jgi:hypothetical protein
MFKVRSGRNRYSIKSSFDEFSLKDWLFYLLFIVDRHSDLFEAREEKGSFSPTWYIKNQELYEQTQIHALKQLCSLGSFSFGMLSPKVVHELIHEHKVIDFIFETPVMKQNPVFKLNRKLYSIQEDFNYLTVKEFAFLDQIFQAFKDKNESKDLDLFCATIYRPAADSSDSGDIREPFDRNTIEKRVKYFSKVSSPKKRLAMLWFEIKRLELPKRYPLLFSGSSSDSSQDWLKTILSMSDGKFGTFTQTENTPILYFLAEMQRAKEEALEAKKQLKQK